MSSKQRPLTGLSIIVLLLLWMTPSHSLTSADASLSAPQIDQLADLFDEIPVFYLLSTQGSAVAVSLGGHETAPIFLDPISAISFARDQLGNPMGSGPGELSLGVMSLTQVYRLQLASSSGADDDHSPSLRFALVGASEQVEAARRILNRDDFTAVPVFAAVSRNGEFMTTRQGDRSVIPLFFEIEVIESALEQLAASGSAVADQLHIEAKALDSVTSDLISGALPRNKVQLVLPQAALEFIRADSQQ